VGILRRHYMVQGDFKLWAKFMKIKEDEITVTLTPVMGWNNTKPLILNTPYASNNPTELVYPEILKNEYGQFECFILDKDIEEYFIMMRHWVMAKNEIVNRFLDIYPKPL